MNAAPSVSYPVGRSPFAAWVTTLLGLAGLAAAAAWTVQSPVFTWRQALAFAASLACGSLAVAAWLRSPTGTLRWDGAGWSWEEGGTVDAGRPDVALDLQSRLLLKWQGEGGATRWLWLESKSDLSHWDALRRAVYSRARPQ